MDENSFSRERRVPGMESWLGKWDYGNRCLSNFHDVSQLVLWLLCFPPRMTFGIKIFDDHVAAFWGQVRRERFRLALDELKSICRGIVYWPTNDRFSFVFAVLRLARCLIGFVAANCARLFCIFREVFCELTKEWKKSALPTPEPVSLLSSNLAVN